MVLFLFGLKKSGSQVVSKFVDVNRDAEKEKRLKMKNIINPYKSLIYKFVKFFCAYHFAKLILERRANTIM